MLFRCLSRYSLFAKCLCIAYILVSFHIWHSFVSTPNSHTVWRKIHEWSPSKYFWRLSELKLKLECRRRQIRMILRIRLIWIKMPICLAKRNLGHFHWTDYFCNNKMSGPLVCVWKKIRPFNEIIFIQWISRIFFRYAELNRKYRRKYLIKDHIQVNTPESTLNRN